MIILGLFWWASLGTAVFLAVKGMWLWAGIVLALGSIVFRVGHGFSKAARRRELSRAVFEIGYNDGSARQIARAERCVRFLLLRTQAEPRFVIYPDELDEAVAEFGRDSQSDELPLVFAAADLVARTQFNGSFALFGRDALASRLGRLPVPELANALHAAFPGFRSPGDGNPGILGQRLDAYTYLLINLAAANELAAAAS